MADRIGLAERVEAAMTKASSMSALLLACGEMTAQERRTARAVAGLMTNVALAALRAKTDPSLKRVEAMRELAIAACQQRAASIRRRADKVADRPKLATILLGKALEADACAGAIRALPVPNEGAERC